MANTPYVKSEIVALLQACSGSDIGLRNRAIIYLLWRTGMRLSELIGCRGIDIDFRQGIVRIVKGKGNKGRVVALDAEAAGVVSQWLAARAKRSIPDSAQIVCTLQGRAVKGNAIRELLSRLKAKAGLVASRVHAHRFRTTFACTVAPQINVIELQAALGHERAETSIRYARSLGICAVNALRRVQW